MLSATARRKIFDRLSWLKGPVVRSATLLRKARKGLSQQLRRVGILRKVLNLPSASDKSFSDWFASNPAGDQWVQIAPEAEFVHPMPTLHDQANRWFFEQHAHAKIDPVGLGILHHGAVHGHNAGQYLNGQGDYLWDFGTENWRYFGCFHIDSVLSLPKPRILPGTAAVLAHEFAHGNFSHWVFDVLPKVDILQSCGLFDSIDWFIVGHSAKRFQMETLADLGIPPEKVLPLDPSSFYQADLLLAPRLCGYRSIHHRNEALRFIEERFGPKQPLPATKRLFVSRDDASFRHMQGEAELFERLRPLGFCKVVLAGLSLRDTIALFQQARAVVGPFGSGLMNIAFCQPGTKVVEIACPGFYNPHHWYLSGERRLDHAVYFGENGLLNPNHPPNQLTRDIVVDIERCFQFIESAI